MSERLYIKATSARIASTFSTPLEKKKMNKSQLDAIEILKAVSCPPPDGEKLEKDVDSDEETEKAVIRDRPGSPKYKIPTPDEMTAKQKASQPHNKPLHGQAWSDPDKPAKLKAEPMSDKYKALTVEDEATVEKALKSSAIVGMARQVRMHNFAAQTAQEQPTVGTNRERSWQEPPVVPVRRVATPEVSNDFVATTDCGQCGYIHKSLEECPCCARIAAIPTSGFPQY